MAGMDLCIHLIRKDLGSQAANAAARNLVAPPHRAGGQAQYPDSPVPHARTMPALPRPSSGRCGTSINR
jgi:transcriptional regulator GlxA family with amidase domain